MHCTIMIGEYLKFIAKAMFWRICPLNLIKCVNNLWHFLVLRAPKYKAIMCSLWARPACQNIWKQNWAIRLVELSVSFVLIAGEWKYQVVIQNSQNHSYRQKLTAIESQLCLSEMWAIIPLLLAVLLIGTEMVDWKTWLKCIWCGKGIR